MKKSSFLIGAFLMAVVFVCVASVYQNAYTGSPPGATINVAGGGITGIAGITASGSAFQFNTPNGDGFFSDGSFHWDAAANVSATSFSGIGSGLTSLNAGNLGSGTVPTARLGSGTASSSTFLRGDQTWAAAGGSGIATNNGFGTGTTISNLFTFNILAIPTNTYDQTGFTYTCTNGQYFLATQAGGFTGMWPGYSINFTGGVQIELIAFIGGATGGSGGNSTLAIIHPRNGVSLTVATPVPKGVSPNIATFTDNGGNVRAYIDGGGQFATVGDEQEGMMFRASFSSITNSMEIGLINADPDGNPGFDISDPFNPSGGGIFTVAKGALFNSLNVRSNGDITAYNGNFVSETGHHFNGVDLTASAALVTDASKNIVSSTTTSAELAFVHNVTSPIQTQLNGLASLSANGQVFTGTNQNFTNGIGAGMSILHATNAFEVWSNGVLTVSINTNGTFYGINGGSSTGLFNLGSTRLVFSRVSGGAEIDTDGSGNLTIFSQGTKTFGVIGGNTINVGTAIGSGVIIQSDQTSEAGNANTAGTPLILKPRESTGTGAGPYVSIYAGMTGSSGTTTNALNEYLRVTTNGITVGGATNTPSFTLVNTNWISGQLYTNLTGRPILIMGNAQMTVVGVSGACQLALQVNGVQTNTASVLTAVASLTGSFQMAITPAICPAGSNFYFTNLSSGAGDSAAPFGGQYMVY